MMGQEGTLADNKTQRDEVKGRENKENSYESRMRGTVNPGWFIKVKGFRNLSVRPGWVAQPLRSSTGCRCVLGVAATMELIFSNLTGAVMKLEDLEDLFKEDLKDVLHAENQIIKALPKMIKTASNEELKAGFTKHLEETKVHVSRLEQVMEELGMPVKGKVCKAMQGIIEEGKEVMEEDAEEDVMDAALIGAAQKVEHYEIATYGTLCTYADLLGIKNAKKLLGQTLAEEKLTDEKLSKLAISVVNLDAVSADD